MNLWADLENNHLLPDTVEHGRPQRMRRITERIILSSLRDWLLQDYVAPYCRSLGAMRIYRRCYWIDGLGIDSKANPLPPPVAPEPQSTTRPAKRRKKESVQVVPPALQPIVTLSQTLALESKPITLYGLMMETGDSKRKETKAAKNGATRDLVLPKESGIARASWLEVAPTLLKEIEQSPTIFLLNPLGLKMFTQDDLAPLYQRTVPTELFLLLPHKQIEAQLLAAAKAPEQAAMLTGVLRTDRWKALLAKEQGIKGAVDGFIELFMAAMQRHFLFPVQRLALPFPSGPAVIEDAPYTLLFATRRQDSLLGMNDAVSRHQRLVHEQSCQGILGEEWFATQQRERMEAAMQQLYQRVLQQGRAQRTRRWPDLRQQLLLANFGQFTLYDYDIIIQKLLLHREVRCEWRRPPVSPEENRVPGNDDTLIWR